MLWLGPHFQNEYETITNQRSQSRKERCWGSSCSWVPRAGVPSSPPCPLPSYAFTNTLSLRKQDDMRNTLYILGISLITHIRLYSRLDIRMTPFKQWFEQPRPGASEHWNSKDSVYQWAFHFMCKIKCALISFLQSPGSLKAIFYPGLWAGGGPHPSAAILPGILLRSLQPQTVSFINRNVPVPLPKTQPALRAAQTSTSFAGRSSCLR